ncbi:unnamed protein product [Symbiodinium sp. CCMP2592]|nr:unnamed protein product [Symbiodinium sp. CCMP2592]
MTTSMKVESPTPAAPASLTMQVRSDRSLVVKWEYAEPAAYTFHVKVEYYDPAGPMIEPVETKSQSCQGLAVHLKACTMLADSAACTVKVSLQASKQDAPHVLSEVVRAQTSWDGEMSADDSACDLEKHRQKFLPQLVEFRESRGCNLKVLVVGGQHHGKSAFVNHLYRCLEKNLDSDDQVEMAPASAEENTQEVLTVKAEGMSLMDTPAIPNMSNEMADAFRSLLNKSIGEGTRRRDLANPPWSISGIVRWVLNFLWNPAHAAVLVVSLLHWRDQKEEMQTYLSAMARDLKNASGGTVTFPFVVAATHRDSFLRDSKAVHPHEELVEVLDTIKRATNTNHVFAVTNYNKGYRGSLDVNQETFSLLSQLVTLASRRDTGVPMNHLRYFLAVLSVVILAIAMIRACL